MSIWKHISGEKKVNKDKRFCAFLQPNSKTSLPVWMSASSAKPHRFHSPFSICCPAGVCSLNHLHKVTFYRSPERFYTECQLSHSETNLVNFRPAEKKSHVIFITLLLCGNKLDQVPILVIILIKGQLLKQGNAAAPHWQQVLKAVKSYCSLSYLQIAKPEVEETTQSTKFTQARNCDSLTLEFQTIHSGLAHHKCK